MASFLASSPPQYEAQTSTSSPRSNLSRRASASAEKKPLGFFCLPSELRLLVYRFVFEDAEYASPSLCRPKWDCSSWLDRHTAASAMLRTCRLIRRDARPVVRHHVRWVIDANVAGLLPPSEYLSTYSATNLELRWDPHEVYEEPQSPNGLLCSCANGPNPLDHRTKEMLLRLKTVIHRVGHLMQGVQHLTLAGKTCDLALDTWTDDPHQQNSMGDSSYFSSQRKLLGDLVLSLPALRTLTIYERLLFSTHQLRSGDPPDSSFRKWLQEQRPDLKVILVPAMFDRRADARQQGLMYRVWSKADPPRLNDPYKWEGSDGGDED